MSYSGHRRARYALPVVVMAAIGGAALVPTLSGASVPSGLAPVTPAQLLADVYNAAPPQLSGTLTWTANLGLSDLSSLENELGGGGSSSSPASGSAGASSSAGAAAGGFDPVSLLSGSYQVDVWLDGAKAEHLALDLPSDEEVDLVRDGGQAWLWDSSNQSVLHLVGNSATGPGATSSTTTSTTADGGAGTLEVTPQQLAQQLLAKVGPTTSVSTGSPVYVAGQAAYQLLVAPKDAAGSTVDRVEVDVGASGALAGVPLQVAVYAAGQAAPALELGYTGVLHLGAPSDAELTFTPPPGSKVTTRQLGQRTSRRAAGGPGSPAGGAGTKILGNGWTAVLTGASAEPSSAVGGAALSGLSSVVNVAGAQARLFNTSLLNVLVMPDGHFYAGFVTPAVLEADAAAAAAG